MKKAETTSSPTTATTTTTIELKKKHMYVEIPYVGQTNNSIRSKFSHLVSKLRPDLSISYPTKPPTPPSIHPFFYNKDRIDKHMQSNIVYFFNCKDCQQTYVGKTDRQARRRMKESGVPDSAFKQQNNDQSRHQWKSASKIISNSWQNSWLIKITWQHEW
jgi:hypothetical protein